MVPLPQSAACRSHRHFSCPACGCGCHAGQLTPERLSRQARAAERERAAADIQVHWRVSGYAHAANLARVQP